MKTLKSVTTFEPVETECPDMHFAVVHRESATMSGKLIPERVSALFESESLAEFFTEKMNVQYGGEYFFKRKVVE